MSQRCNLVRRLTVAAVLLQTLLAGSYAANLSQAVVRQKVNVVTRASSISADPQPVAEGAVVQDQNVVRTGNASRAELQFPDSTLARLGANSIFTFDAQDRVLNCTRGAALFSKPPGSGRVEIRAGAVTAAITGSTGFVSNQPYAQNGRKRTGEMTTMLGMLEGKIQGVATWRDDAGRDRRFSFKLGAGDMMVAQPGRQPVVVQFDIPRFLRTSPLVQGFSGPLPNYALINRAVAEYEKDQQRGFVDRSNLFVSSQPIHTAWVPGPQIAGTALDVGVSQHSTMQDGGFIDIGGSGVLRGQLVWNTSADLDLHLILPDQQEVFFGNRSVTFNDGQATAELDQDNLGGTIDVPPSTRVENIAVNGNLLAGNYTFFVNSFNASNGSDSFTLRVGYQGNIQTISGTLADGQNSTPIVINVPPGG